ncbi:MAG TPA: DUF445 domain-containing protein [Gemmatimonadales bacterium]|nr:DUF445 domain-containing protein [Gemmatimonadales bacterium]
MTPPPPILNEEVRRRELARMKAVAAGALVVAAVVFIVARLLEDEHPWLAYVRATAEASLVGGLADWFAVTALFRHPMGIPIPHTAILQKQKDRVGRILGNFVQNHFLQRSVLEARLAGIHPADRAADWMAQPANQSLMARHLAGGLARAVESLPEDEVRALMRRGATSRLEKVQLAPLVGDVLEVAATGSRPQELLGEVIRAVITAVRDGHELIRTKVREESPRWLPVPVREAVADRIIGGIERTLNEMLENPSHPIRRRFDSAVGAFIVRLKSSPEMQQKLEGFKQELIGHPMVEEIVESVWDHARATAAKYRDDPEGSSLEPLEQVLAGVAESLATNQELRAEVDHFAIDAIATVLEQNRGQAADMIADTVAGWDPQLAAERIELAVGRDLQFVRLNGTLVGGLAGLVIYSLMQVL